MRHGDIITVHGMVSRYMCHLGNSMRDDLVAEKIEIVVQPFDRSLISEIERAIRSSGLGLNPATDGNLIRIPIPPLNEQRRKEFAKVLHKMAEEGRVSIRHARRIVRDELHELVKKREVGEDDTKKREEALDKLTHDYTTKVDDLLKKKEAEVMAI